MSQVLKISLYLRLDVCVCVCVCVCMYIFIYTDYVYCVLWRTLTTTAVEKGAALAQMTKVLGHSLHTNTISKSVVGVF